MRHSSLEKYTSQFIWKGCVRELVGDWTELQHIDPHSIGHDRVSFQFSWAAQPGALEPSLSGCWFSLYHIWSPTADFLSSPGLYNDLIPTLLPASVTIALIQPVHGEGYNILIFLDRNLHRCISYFDSLAGLEVNMQHAWFKVNIPI